MRPVDFKPPLVGRITSFVRYQLTLNPREGEWAHAGTRRDVVQKELEAKYVMKLERGLSYDEFEMVLYRMPSQYVINVEKQLRGALAAAVFL